MYYKPKEIAKALNVSTSALRHYESWGIVPAPQREKNGYRKYTEVHFAYFRCIRALFPTVDMGLISKMLLHVQKKEMNQALWIMNEVQANLYQEKKVAEQTFELLHSSDLLTRIEQAKFKNTMTIGQIAKRVNVATSAIRYWENAGLIEPMRDPENGYRLYNQTHLRQILLIRIMRNTIYSMETMKNIVKAVEHSSIEQAKKVTREALETLNYRNQGLMHGVHELYRLCEVTGLLQKN